MTAEKTEANKKRQENAMTPWRYGAKQEDRFSENQTSRIIIRAAIEVHRVLGGPGLLESVYEEALVHELALAGLSIERQKRVPIRYKGISLNNDLRLDLLVDQKVIVECKAAQENHSLFRSQALTYLRLTGLKLALVVNFGQPLVKDGFQRIVNRF